MRRQVDLAVSTYQPSHGLTVPVRQCGQCGAPVRAPRDSCGRCGRRVRSKRLAGALALAFPGAGHAYAERPLFAALRCAVELSVFSWLATRVLGAGTPGELITPVVTGLVAIGALKVQGIAVAGCLAERAELVTPAAERRWRWFAGLAGVLSLCALLFPLVLAGQTDTDVSWDLDFVVSGSEWHGDRASPTQHPESSNDPVRSRWVHREGLLAEVRAWPLRPFESATAAEERYLDHAEGDAEIRVLGAHRAIATRIDGHDRTTLRFAVVDDSGRDLHVVSAEIRPEDAGQAGQELERLISRGVWIPAKPSGSARR